MTNDDTINISRRKILGSLGAVGVGAAGAGLGTTAFLSDTESFEGNVVTAGMFGLKVDWEEHYSYPQLYDDADGEPFADPTAGLDVQQSDPGDDSYVGIPDPENPMVWIHEEDLDAYMANTAIEAFPDPDNDGQQEIEYTDVDEEVDFTYMPCRDGADMPDQLDPTIAGPASRTQNGGTWDGDEEDWKPLISLEDVKPGDFGEFTFSFHLCDSPGHVWLQAGNLSESGGANPEPEVEAEGDDDNDPNLAENIETVWWYDDGDNVLEEGEDIGAVDVMLAVDTSGSLTDDNVADLQSAANDLATDLDDESGDARIGGLSFGNGSIDDFTGLSGSPVQFSGLTPGGNTPTPAALEIAAQELDANANADAETFIVLFTDGGPNYDDNEYSVDGVTYTAGPYDSDTPGDDGVVDESELEETAGIATTIRDDHQILTVGINDQRKPSGREGDDPADIYGTGPDGYLSSYLQNQIAGDPSDYFSAEDSGTVSNILSQITAAIASIERVIQRGNLQSVVQDDLSSRLPLDGDLTTEFDEFEDDEFDENRDCFQTGVTYYLGFAWWIPPEEVGNEIQGDTVSFDIGVYAEQCENNGESEPTEPPQ